MILGTNVCEEEVFVRRRSGLGYVVLAILALLIGGAGWGCSGQAQRPESAVEAYISAVQGRDAESVFVLLDDSSRMGMDEATFRQWFAENYTMILEQAEKINAQADDAEVKAELPLSRGHLARLVYEKGAWRLAHQQMARGLQKSPRDTLTAFSDALARGDFETILGLLSAERRSAYIQEMEALQGQLRSASGSGIVSKGDQAVLPLSGGGRIVFVRENGAWKIEAFEQETK